MEEYDDRWKGNKRNSGKGFEEKWSNNYKIKFVM